MELTPPTGHADLLLYDQGIRRFTPMHTAPMIACCNCAKPIQSTSTIAMCDDCIKINVDITAEVDKEGEVLFCKDCGRLQIPPNNWIHAPRESRALLGACLKRLKGLSKLRLVDAKFQWTEPHSRRTKIKVTVQGEASEFQGATILQQSFVVELYEASGQCPDCAKSYTANTWVASVQLRQKVSHKKTFFFVEQLILRHKADKDTVSIQESREGLDFFFASRTEAVKMVDFLSSIVPVRSKRSEELVSTNSHTGNKSFKFTFSVEIVPICKEDLVVLPKRLARSLGSINPLTLCHRIGNTVHLLDATTLQTAELTASNYWKQPFDALLSSGSLVEFMVLDVESTGEATDKFALADATVALVADLGKNDTTYFVRTHLGGILHPGDTVLGYQLEHTNFNSKLWDGLDAYRTPEVVLVKKSYPEKPRKAKRSWKLRRMAKEYNDQPQGLAKAKAADAFERQQQEYEEFLRELEEDKEFRSEINLYKADEDDEDKQVQVEDDGDSDSEIGVKMSELKLDEEAFIGRDAQEEY